MAAAWLAVSKTWLFVAASGPVVGLLAMSRTHVKAAGRKVHPSELDIYDKPIVAQEAVLGGSPASSLEVQVSTGRKAIWGYWDNVKGFVAKAKSTFETVSTKSVEFVELVTTDQVFQIKVGCISAGVLGGAVLAGRGRRPFRRVFYSVGLGTVAASLCYPNRAADVSLTGYRKARVFIGDQWTKYKESTPSVTERKHEEKVFEPTEDSKQEQKTPEVFVVTEQPTVVPEKSEFVAEEVEDLNAANIEEVGLIKEDPEAPSSASGSTESMITKVPFLGWFFKSKPSAVDANREEQVQSAERRNENQDTAMVSKEDDKEEQPVKIERDYGQSNPEDKDMYSTRS